MSAGRPNRWTGQIARVRGVMAASIRAASMTYVSGSMSTKTGVGAGVQDPADRRVERVADGDDLIARPETQTLEDAHQRDRAVADRDRVLGADEGGPALLEFGGPATPGEHAALEDGGDGGDLLRADVRACDGDHDALAPCGMDGSGRSTSASPSMA